jgi:SAM-dependent methyltransferase
MSETSEGHLNTEAWREGYLEGRRNLLRDNRSEYLRRLELMGILALPSNAGILDFGSGDGNLLRLLDELGYDGVKGLEPDPAIVARSACADRVVIGGGPELPFADESFDAVVSNAVVHHLPDLETIAATVRDIARVLKPGGLFAWVEPADTLSRTLLTAVLMSPLSGLTEFSRQKRLMVEGEQQTLRAWLAIEREFADRFVVPAGFSIRFLKRGALKTIARAVKDPP